MEEVRQRTRPAVHPGLIFARLYYHPYPGAIADIGKALGLTEEQVKQFLQGQYDLTPDLAHALAQWLDATPELWLNMQTTYDQTKGLPNVR